MIIQTAHFGQIDYEEEKKLHFLKGLPGLEEDTEFALLASEDTRPVYWLQSLVHPQISLPVVNPLLLCPTYSFDISDSDIDALEIKEEKDICILSVLVIPANDPNAMTVNLTAPIIVNMKNRHGRQIFLDDRNYSTRMRVSDLLSEKEKGAAV